MVRAFFISPLERSDSLLFDGFPFATGATTDADQKARDP